MYNFFAFLADHRVKIKENTIRDEYLMLTENRKKKKTVDYEGDGDTNWKSELKWLEIGGRIETVQTIAFFRSARMLRRDLETRTDLLSLKTSEKSSLLS